MRLKTLVCLSLITIAASLVPAARAQTFSAIHAFTEGNGVGPVGGVSLRAGVLYGTATCTGECDSSGSGIVYQINPVGSSWYYVPIFAFTGIDGAGPQARVVVGPDNRLYGTTVAGGTQNAGVVFSLTPPISVCKTAKCFWTETELHQFMGSPDAGYPGYGDLVWDPMGNIYGTTRGGGNSNLGTVFQMTKSGNQWTETPIYSFTGPDGNYPIAGVIRDSNGNLFGTTLEGGLYGFGTIFELTYNINSGWTETVLYNFQNLNDGQQPYTGVIRDSAGNFYGAASDGGNGGGGTIFELSPVGDTWTFTTIYSLTGQQGIYCGPRASLALDNSGNLYGTTNCDGANRFGNVFKLTNTQNRWVYTSLHDFADSTDGALPVSVVTIDTDGTLYGTAASGGNLSCNAPYGCGTVWMIKP